MEEKAITLYELLLAIIDKTQRFIPFKQPPVSGLHLSSLQFMGHLFLQLDPYLPLTHPTISKKTT